MVMFLSSSFLNLTVWTPEMAFTTVDFPWATWPMVPSGAKGGARGSQYTGAGSYYIDTYYHSVQSLTRTNIDGSLSADNFLGQRCQGGHILEWGQHTLDWSHTHRHSEQQQSRAAHHPSNPGDEHGQRRSAVRQAHKHSPNNGSANIWTGLPWSNQRQQHSVFHVRLCIVSKDQEGEVMCRLSLCLYHNTNASASNQVHQQLMKLTDWSHVVSEPWFHQANDAVLIMKTLWHNTKMTTAVVA